MRALLAICLVGLALGGCSGGKKAAAKADAKAANFKPPSPLTRQEYGVQAERRFHQLDANGDGRLSSNELPEDARATLMAFDTDGDGTISPGEWTKGMMKRFDDADRNQDGELIPGEGPPLVNAL